MDRMGHKRGHRQDCVRPFDDFSKMGPNQWSEANEVAHVAAIANLYF